MTDAQKSAAAEGKVVRCPTCTIRGDPGKLQMSLPAWFKAEEPYEFIEMDGDADATAFWCDACKEIIDEPVTVPEAYSRLDAALRERDQAITDTDELLRLARELLEKDPAAAEGANDNNSLAGGALSVSTGAARNLTEGAVRRARFELRRPGWPA